HRQAPCSRPCGGCTRRSRPTRGSWPFHRTSVIRISTRATTTPGAMRHMALPGRKPSHRPLRTLSMRESHPNFSVIPGDFIETVLSDTKPKIIDIVCQGYLLHHHRKTINPDSYFLRFDD